LAVYPRHCSPLKVDVSCLLLSIGVGLYTWHYLYWNIIYQLGSFMDVLDWHLDHMFLLVNIYMQAYFCDGVNSFSWWCSLMKYYISYEFLKLSQNQFHDGNSHEIANSHEIHFMAVTLTKYQTLTKSIPWRWPSWNSKLSWKPFVKVNSHEIPQKTIMTTPTQTWWQLYFHEGDRHGLPPRKESMAVNSHENGIFVCLLSWKLMRDGVPSRIIFMRVKPYFVTCSALSRNLWILVVSWPELEPVHAKPRLASMSTCVTYFSSLSTLQQVHV
jgi:hypothetical protein